jgi:hypothetical protein
MAEIAKVFKKYQKRKGLSLRRLLKQQAYLTGDYVIIFSEKRRVKPKPKKRTTSKPLSNASPLNTPPMAIVVFTER